MAKLPEAIVAKISWLTCNDKSCVPGKEEASPRGSQIRMLVKKAYAALPDPVPGAKLSYEASDDVDFVLTLTLPPERS